MLHFLAFLYFRANEISCSAELSKRKFYSVGPSISQVHATEHLCDMATSADHTKAKGNLYGIHRSI